ncbi:MAG: hypothetical protein K9M49_09940, partial [Candidatus Marinimicrobia bacterium]|nr:hypothetical protein [Candidatus Neomarinimicrobiota bacterium]
DDDGRFQLDYLNDQEYLLFYHWDRNRDRKINTGDYFGRPKTANVYARNDTLLPLQKIWPQVIPNDRVKLLEVSMLADSLAQIRTNLRYTNETLDSLNIHQETEQIDILGASRVEGDEVAMLLSLSDDLVEGNQVWVTGFIDTSGYRLTSDTLQLDKQARVDSLQLNPFNISWLENDQLNYPEDPDEIIIRSNLPFTFESDTAFQVFTAGNDSVPIPGVLEVVNTMSWLFSPAEALGDGKTYQWKIQTEHIRSRYQQNELDSLWTGKLQIISADSLGSIRLMHMGIHVLECTLSGGTHSRKFQLRPGTSLLISDLPATSYQLIGYVDANGNGRYDSDQMTPVGGSEEFWVYPEPINVRARWETDIGIWRLRSEDD